MSDCIGIFLILCMFLSTLNSKISNSNFMVWGSFACFLKYNFNKTITNSTKCLLKKKNTKGCGFFEPLKVIKKEQNLKCTCFNSFTPKYLGTVFLSVNSCFIWNAVLFTDQLTNFTNWLATTLWSTVVTTYLYYCRCFSLFCNYFKDQLAY